MIQNADMRLESGTCNVCSAICSSCVHLNQALMGSKAEEYSDDNCRLVGANRYSAYVGDGSYVRGKTCERLKHSDSETSNMPSIFSSHGSLSENTDSKQAFSEKCQDSKCLEGLDDSISCIGRAGNANLVSCSNQINSDKINISSSSASVSLFGAQSSAQSVNISVSSDILSKYADIPEKLSEFCMENVDSSLTKEREPIIVSGEKSLPDKDELVSGTVKVSQKFYPKSKADADNDVSVAEDGDHKRSTHDGLHEKAEERVKSLRISVPQPEDDSDESDLVEQDVKVCDICGDSGREHLLAICSRCSDGAEHTYCMRKMLKKVPDGDWFCEECQCAEETANQRLDVEGKVSHEVGSTSQVSGKRSSEIIEVAAAAAKRGALESSTGSPKASRPRRLVPLSRESSFKRLENGKVKPGQTLMRTGTLLKSSSFNNCNSKSRVKLDDDVPLKQKGGDEHVSKNMETPGRTIGKSMSFKSLNLGRTSESKARMLSSKSGTAQERTSTSVYETQQNGLPRLRETENQGDKTKDSYTHRARSGTNTSKSPCCHKCKDYGHTTECCTVGGKQEFGADGSVTAISSSKDLDKGNGLKAAIQAALLKRPKIHKRKDLHDQIDQFATSGKVLKCKVSSQDQVEVSASNTLKNSIYAEEINARQEILGNSTPEMSKCFPASDLKHLKTDLCSQLKKSDSLSHASKKPAVSDLVNRALEISSFTSEMSAVPEYKYIWQGVFEVNRSGKSPDLYTGIQAHLSSCASAKVLGVVNKFLPKISLHEVSRLSTWPSHFHQYGAKEDNIALYFFAKDIESYERHYKSLLDHMIRHDLALRGFFDGVELLIFASNQFPENSQRWNALFFLWGIFRGRRINHSDSAKNIVLPSLNVAVPNEKDFPTAVMTLSDTLCSPVRIDEESTACGKACSELPATSIDQDNRINSKSSSRIPCADDQKILTASSTMKDKISERTNNDENQRRHKRKDREDDLNINVEATFQEDLAIEAVNCRQPNDIKVEHVDHSDTVMEAPVASCQEMPRVNGKLEDTNSSTKLQSMGSSSVEDKGCKEPCDEKIIHEDLGTMKKTSFPFDTHNTTDSRMVTNSMPLEGPHECGEKFEDGIPSLELALGGEMKQSMKGMLPFIGGKVDKKNNQEKAPDYLEAEQEGDDSVAASLSLSMSFPSSNKEPTNPASKDEHHVNSSLLLSGRFTGK